MIQTLNRSSHLVTKLLIVGALVCAFKYRAEIKDFIHHNETAQEFRDGVKWLAEELRPLTEAEKKQRQEYVAEQRRRAEELRSLGVNPHIKYVTPKDKEWAEAVRDYNALMKGKTP